MNDLKRIALDESLSTHILVRPMHSAQTQRRQVLVRSKSIATMPLRPARSHLGEGSDDSHAAPPSVKISCFFDHRQQVTMRRTRPIYRCYPERGHHVLTNGFTREWVNGDIGQEVFETLAHHACMQHWGASEQDRDVLEGSNLI